MKKIIIILTILIIIFWRINKNDTIWEVYNTPTSAESVIAIGDSLTFGKGADKNKTYPEILGKMLGFKINNMGRNGATTRSLLEETQHFIKENPDLIFITLGGNDLIRRLPFNETLKNLDKIFTKLQNSGALIVYLAIEPPLSSSKWINGIKEICRKNKVLYVPQVMEGLWGDPSLMSDTIHPNSRGYQIMATRTYKIVKDHINK